MVKRVLSGATNVAEALGFPLVLTALPNKEDEVATRWLGPVNTLVSEEQEDKHAGNCVRFVTHQ